MRVHDHSPTYLALCSAMALLTACVPQRSPELSVGPSRSFDVITEAEIAESQARTAYDAVEGKHPLFLTSKIDLAPNAERQVYLNGILLGGLRELRFIPATEVKEIRFVRAIDGGAYGVGRSGGAILVISKSGR
jgi:hypothetical protein